jgi:hypothetical protein
MRPSSQAPAHPSHKGGTDTSVITRALDSQSFSHTRRRLFDARIIASGLEAIKSFIANHPFLQYRTRTGIHFFCAQSLALETNNSHTHDSMSTMWSLR